jgi:amidohydrolase
MLLLILSFTLLLSAPAAWADPAKISKAIDEAGPAGRAVSRNIWDFKEQGMKEFKSSALLMEELRKLGYTVTGNLKVPEDAYKEGALATSFKAELRGKGPGPTVVIMLEYDALANGHACGHNLIASSGLLAATGLAKVMADTPGKVVVMGTPDEEGAVSSGKVALVAGGHFEGADAVFITHPSDRWSLDQRLLAMKRAVFTFKGTSAHAAAAPHKGVNALRGVLLTFNCIDSLREHLRQDVRIHGIINKGGERVNVVPDNAQATFLCRALDTATMEDAYGKLANCARAAALGTGATLEFVPRKYGLTASIAVPPLNDSVKGNLAGLGIGAGRLKDFDSLASSDLGNVGYARPTVNLWFQIAPEGTALHTDAFREAANSDEAWKATVTAAKAVALSAYEMLTQPSKLKAVQDAYREAKLKEGK